MEHLEHLREDEVHVGDWVEADLVSGSSRRGQITELIGEGAHRHFRVRWDERHESIYFPADGARLLRLVHEADSG